jgi:hypothetical protein
MSVHEERVQLHDRLEELVGVSGADILLDRPPGGWSDLVTNDSLDRRFAASEARFDRKFDALDHKIDALEAGVDRKFDALEAGVDRKFDALMADMELRFAGIDARFGDVDHRFDRFEHELLASVDRRLRSQAWMTISTIVAVGGVLVAAIRL